MVGCPSKNGGFNHEACVLTTQQMPVLCCGANPAQAASVVCEDAVQKTFEEADRFCRSQGYHICTMEELAGDGQCNTQCAFDYVNVWTASECSPHEQAFDCLAQPDDWHDSWSVEQKEVCCRSSGTGCYDCSNVYMSPEQWSSDRGEFCCRMVGVGCPSGARSVLGASAIFQRASDDDRSSSDSLHWGSPPLSLLSSLAGGIVLLGLGFLVVARVAGPAASRWRHLRAAYEETLQQPLQANSASGGEGRETAIA